ncbi:MAG: hypothetical protein EBV06_17445, partial [Planctomycetia bacterium]|nr:hypothetical protein [Planctomycetia bacterium]
AFDKNEEGRRRAGADSQRLFESRGGGEWKRERGERRKRLERRKQNSWRSQGCRRAQACTSERWRVRSTSDSERNRASLKSKVVAFDSAAARSGKRARCVRSGSGSFGARRPLGASKPGSFEAGGEVRHVRPPSRLVGTTLEVPC